MDTPLRFGVLGCGGIGPTHVGALGQIPDARCVAVCDTVPERARALAEKAGVPRIHTRLDDLLDDPQVDAVCVCTPSGLHVAHAVAALERGKHVVVEKPVDVSLEACDQLIAAQERTGLAVAVIHQHRFDRASLLARELVDSGRLGRLVLADAEVRWYRRQAYYDSGDWRGTWAMDGGGALMNQGVHTVDLLQWLAGPVRTLHAFTRTAAHERIEVEDVAVASLSFANGAVGTLTATTAAFDGFPVRLCLHGTEGSVVLEGDRLRRVALRDGQTYETEEAAAHALSVARGGTASVREEAHGRDGASDPGAVWGDSHRAQLEDFVDAVRVGRAPLLGPREARRPLEIILAVYRSARTGLPVTLENP